MTEEAWFNFEKGSNLVVSLQARLSLQTGWQPSPRKILLHNAALSRLYWPQLSERALSCIWELEEVADQPDPASGVNTLRRQYRDLDPNFDWYKSASHHQADMSPVAYLACSARDIETCARWLSGPQEQTHLQLARDIFGNPFRPVAFAPEWRTAAAVGIATAMYESREFANMPILADALEDAGCDSPESLDHCRGPGPHVRGCWVVDLVLGKS